MFHFASKVSCIGIICSLTLTLACKPAVKESSSSEVKVSVKVGGAALDLTTFKKSTPAMVTAMKKEIQTFAKKKYVYETELAAQNAMIAKLKKKKPTNLTEGELVGLWLYTSGPFSVMNTALRTGTGISKMANTIKVISSAINKLPSAGSCTLYRGSKRDAATLKIYQAAIKKGFISDNAFTSTSVKKLISEQFAEGKVSVNAATGQIAISAKKNDGILAVIKSTKCHDVTFQTKFDQGERLFPPGTEFKILSTSSKTPVKGKMWVVNMQWVKGGTMAKGKSATPVKTPAKGAKLTGTVDTEVDPDTIWDGESDGTNESMSLTEQGPNFESELNMDPNEAFADSSLFAPFEESDPNAERITE